jgi:ribonuclease VapC
VIVLDSSAILAILLQEPDAAAFANALAANPQRVMSTGTYLELVVVTERRSGPRLRAFMDEIVGDASIELRPFDALQSKVAADAFVRFGREKHPAALNYGDCFSYALAKSLDVPLLFKGGDFALTDVRSAIPS